jgi:hypothetical protein
MADTTLFPPARRPGMPISTAPTTRMRTAISCRQDGTRRAVSNSRRTTVALCDARATGHLLNLVNLKREGCAPDRTEEAA